MAFKFYKINDAFASIMAAGVLKKGTTTILAVVKATITSKLTLAS